MTSETPNPSAKAETKPTNSKQSSPPAASTPPSAKPDPANDPVSTEELQTFADGVTAAVFGATSQGVDINNMAPTHQKIMDGVLAALAKCPTVAAKVKVSAA